MGWAGGSLRGRLVLAFVAVAVLAAVLVGVITLSLIRLVPERGLEQQLADQAQAVSDTVAGPRPARQLCALARVLRRGETEVYLLSADAIPRRLPLCQAPNRRGPLAPAPDVDLSAALAQDRVATGTGDGLAWAVIPADRPAPRSGGAAAQGVRPALRPGGGVLLVHEVRRLGLSLLPVVAWRLLLATGLAVAVAALAAWLLAGRLTAPLGRLVTAARQVGDGDLSTRVRVDGDGEVAEVATAFNDMAAGLERAQTEQRAFLASVGHELKTPLTGVQGYTEALLDGTVDDPAERRRSLLRVHAETIRLARLVQDLLDLARRGRGQFAVSTVDADVGAVLREAATAAAERAAARQVTVTTRLDGDLNAHVDPGRLRQVLDNLLDNAVRSSPSGGQVLVAARPLEEGGVEAAIVDQGPGIAPEDLPQAFDRGYLWSRYRGTREAGSGLGLAIVKALCDAMGVGVQAESGHGGGTAFRLILPPSRTRPATSRPRVGPTAPSELPTRPLR
ncbi:MAG TPA: HAMP domain-containing sensor histidine kinase [Actinomycetes bacterium]|nr:HAMP domain-containing sensor histidine kinase [Actinomycetes bacterium]